MRLPQPPGHLIPVTSKLTVVEASCVSVPGSTVDVAADSVLLESSGAFSLGCGAQPTASSIVNTAKCLSFIGPLSKKRKIRCQPEATIPLQSIERTVMRHHLSESLRVHFAKTSQNSLRKYPFFGEMRCSSGFPSRPIILFGMFDSEVQVKRSCGSPQEKIRIRNDSTGRT